MSVRSTVFPVLAAVLFIAAVAGGIASLMADDIGTAALIFIGGIMCGGILLAISEGLNVLERFADRQERERPFDTAKPPIEVNESVRVLPFATRQAELVQAEPEAVEAPEVVEKPALEAPMIRAGDTFAAETADEPAVEAAVAPFDDSVVAETAVADAHITSMPMLERILFVLGVVGLLIVQAGSSLIHWLRLPPSTFDPLSGPICEATPRFCELRYPPYFIVYLLPLLVISLVLLAFSMRRMVLPLTRGIATKVVEAMPRIDPWWRTTRGMAGVAAAWTLLTVVNALTATDRYPNVFVWLVMLFLWGVVFYSFDRAYQRPAPMSRRVVLGLVAYFLLLVVLSFVYQFPLLQSVGARAVFVVVAVVAVLALWQTKRLSSVAAVFAIFAIAGMAIYVHNLTSWRYAFLGDEYAFQQAASTYFVNTDLPHILSARFVYDAHPTLSSFLQAASMKLHGDTAYGWRVNEVLIVFMTAPGIYALARRLKGVKTGLLAAFLFLSAHHLIAFVHIGANNLHGLPGFMAMLVFALIALESRSLLAVFLSAVAGAFAFYTFSLMIPLIPLPLVLFALWVLMPGYALPWRERIRAMLPLVLVFVFGALLTALPRLTNTTWLDNAAMYTVANTELRGLSSPLFEQMIPNAVYALTSSLYFAANSHYTSGGNIDPLTSLLMLVGLAGVLGIITRRLSALWLVIIFLITVFIVGGLVPYEYPGHSRTFLLVTFWSVFAALGAAYLWQALRAAGISLSAGVRWSVVGVLVVAVVALNLYQFNVLSEQDIEKSPIALVMQQLEETTPETTLYFVANVPEDGNLTMVVVAMGYDPERVQRVMNPAPLEALREVRNTAVAPYRIVMQHDMENPAAWYGAAQEVWPERVLQRVYDDADMQYVTILDVPN